MSSGNINYLKPLGVSSVDLALDWTWLVDIGQGNFADAAIDAIEALEKQRNPHTLLTRAVVHQLQGEYNQALSLFELAYQTSQDSEQKLKIAAMAYWTELKAGEILPDGFSFNFEDIKLNSSWRKRTQSLKINHHDSSTWLESCFVCDVCAILPTFRTVTWKLSIQNRVSEYLEEIKEQLTKQLEIYQSLEIYNIINALYSSMADLFVIAGAKEEALKMLQALGTAYEKSENYLEAAWYLLCQGDLFLSNFSVGKPICFGYFLSDSTKNMLSIEHQSLFDRSNIDDINIHEYYYQARKYFAAAGAHRGEALAIFRLSYLNALADRWHLASQGYEEAKERFSQLGDSLNAIAAEMAQLWTYTYYEEPPADAIVKAEKLAGTMRDNGAVAWGISWGLAFANAAHHSLLKEENIEAALWSASLAETIFDVFAQVGSMPILSNLEPYHRQLRSQVLYRAYDVEGIMQVLYANLAQALADTNNWTEAFTIAEMVRSCVLPTVISKAKTSSEGIHKLNQTLVLEEVAVHLSVDTLLLNYLILDRRLLAWAVNSQGLVGQYSLNTLTDRPFSADLFFSEAKSWIKQMAEGTTDRRWGEIFSKILLEPFSKQIDRATHLVIVPFAQLSTFPFQVLPWQNQTLGLVKNVSYLPTVSQLQQFRTPSLDRQRSLIVESSVASLTNSSDSDLLQEFNLGAIIRGQTQAIAQFYQTNLLVGLEASKEAIFAQLELSPQIVHLFVRSYEIANNSLTCGIILDSGPTISAEELIDLNFKTDLVILSICDQKSSNFSHHPSIDLAQSLIYAGSRAVIVNFWRTDDLANGMLLDFLHQTLSQNQSLADCLHIAQQQLCQVTVQQAINFCQTIQAYIPWQNKLDRARRAILTQYMGDYLAFGGNYARAVEAYTIAIDILSEAECLSQIEALKLKHRYIKSLIPNQSSFNGDRLVFNSPEYWGSSAIFGDWR